VPQHYKCDRTTEVIAYVRLLVEPPVTVQWPKDTQTLSVINNPHQPFGKIALTVPSSWTREEHCHSGGHAYHVVKNGMKIKVPSVFSTFFERLICEGRAEYIWGPHSDLYWRPTPKFQMPAPHAYYGYIRKTDLPLDDVAPGHTPPRNLE
jgi:hypothetical protein